MPKKKQHKKQAKHNKKFLDTIEKNNYPDWFVTVLFYIALHYNDAKLSEFGLHPDSHPERFNTIREFSGKKYWKSYRRLYNYSRISRYEPGMWKGKINEKIISRLLDDLKNIKETNLNNS